MATIRASCDTCGDVEFAAAQVTVHAPEHSGPGTYTFTCPHCRDRVVRSADRTTIDLLIAAGVQLATSRPPAELAEREHLEVEPITHDDLVAFHRLVEDDAALAAALEGIDDPHPR